MFKTLKSAWEYVGGLSSPSKMPCLAWSISALLCNVGGRLALQSNSVCSDCYALKGRYSFDNVKEAQARRLAAYYDRPHWERAMARLINHYCRESGVFRWFDAGDLQGEAMLRKIAAVADLTPGIQHWLPTKEYGIVRKWKQSGGHHPANLTVRVSAPYVDEFWVEYSGLPVSNTTRDLAKSNCHAYLSEDKEANCGSCRICWDPEQTPIYPVH